MTSRSNYGLAKKPLGAKRYHPGFEYAPEPLWTTDLDGNIQEFNRSAAELLERSQDSLAGKNLSTLVPQKERHAFRLRLAELRGSDQIREWEQQMLRANGVVFQAQLRAGIIRGVNGHPIALCYSAHAPNGGPTAQLGARYRFLATAARQLHTTFDMDTLTSKVVHLAVPAFADLCVLHLRDEAGRIAQIQVAHRHPETERALAEKEKQHWMVMEPSGELQDPTTADTRKLVTRVLDGLARDIAYADEHLRALSGIPFKSYISVPLRAGGQALGAIVFAIMDSDRMYGAVDLEQAEDLARHASIAIANVRLYAKAQATLREREAAMVRSWQEARLPLNVLSSVLQILKRHAQGASPEGSDNEEPTRVVIEHATWRTNLQYIEQATEQLLNLSSMIAELDQLQNGTAHLLPAWLNLSQVVYGVVQDLRAQVIAGRYPRTIRVDTEIPTSPSVWAQADRSQIERVIANVIDNAVKFSPPEGRVNVKLSVEEDLAEGDEPQAHLTVADQGIGVPLAEQARVFEPFARGSNTIGKNFSGTGIGLTVSREIVRQHHGKIWIESEGVGQGSTVHIILPRAQLDIESLDLQQILE